MLSLLTVKCFGEWGSSCFVVCRKCRCCNWLGLSRVIWWGVLLYAVNYVANVAKIFEGKMALWKVNTKVLINVVVATHPLLKKGYHNKTKNMYKPMKLGNALILAARILAAWKIQIFQAVNQNHSQNMKKDK